MHIAYNAFHTVVDAQEREKGSNFSPPHGGRAATPVWTQLNCLWTAHRNIERPPSPLPPGRRREVGEEAAREHQNITLTIAMCELARSAQIDRMKGRGSTMLVRNSNLFLRINAMKVKFL